ncbi:MAG: hypothetical protein ACJAWX_003154, partial [Algoriphagus sp.]
YQQLPLQHLGLKFPYFKNKRLSLAKVVATEKNMHFWFYPPSRLTIRP